MKKIIIPQKTSHDEIDVKNVNDDFGVIVGIFEWNASKEIRILKRCDINQYIWMSLESTRHIANSQFFVSIEEAIINSGYKEFYVFDSFTEVISWADNHNVSF